MRRLLMQHVSLGADTGTQQPVAVVDPKGVHCGDARPQAGMG